MRKLPAAGWIGILLATFGLANAGEEVRITERGLQVGAKAPAFSLPDQAGQNRSLDELLKKGKVALVFYRSASW